MYAVMVLAILLPLCQLSLASPPIVEDDIIRTHVAISGQKIKRIGFPKFSSSVFHTEIYSHQNKNCSLGNSHLL